VFHQGELFSVESRGAAQSDCEGIEGLTYFPGLLPTGMQAQTLSAIDANPWQDDLKRRVQHYGYKYDYKARRIDPSMFVGPLPGFAVEVANQLLAYQLMPEMPDQLIVNEYRPGQGIAAHVDCVPCFKDTIATVSLGSACEMDFIEVESGTPRSMWLEAGSALVLAGDARYRWMHRIRARASDRGVRRGRRVSLTFRNVIV